MAFRRHRAGVLAPALLLLVFGPALRLLTSSRGCGCSMPSGPCACCLPADSADTNADRSPSSHASHQKQATGHCHLRQGTCETSAPHPVVLTSDSISVGVLESAGDFRADTEVTRAAELPAHPTEDPASGPDPPPPRSLS